MGFPYSGCELDRGGGLRGDQGWLDGLLADPASLIIPMWRDNCLAESGEPVRIAVADAADLLDAATDVVFLGAQRDGTAVFAADMSALDEPTVVMLADGAAASDVRALFPRLSGPGAAALAYAKGILHWHREQRFCGSCGGTTRAGLGGHQRGCDGCGRLLFPRIEPCVITLVSAPGQPERALLARHRGAGPGAFATLAGFVEIGESLEDAVRREVAEEAGVAVGEMSYFGSQPWPFPAGIMVGFHAHALNDEIHVDGDELEEARWFTRAEMGAAGVGQRHDSIEHYLIEDWLGAASPARS